MSVCIGSVEQKQSSLSKQMLICLMANLIIVLSGQVALPLPFTPVPVCLQSSVILLMAALLGSKRGFCVTLAFLLEGAMGFPVFAKGAGSIAVFLGPTGGYLIGYLFASYLTGWLMERSRKTNLQAFYALGAGTCLILLCGAFHLSFFLGVKGALLLGVLPFIAGDLLKIFLSIKLLKWNR